MADEQQHPGQHHQSGSLLPTALQGAESSALQLKIKNSICKSVQSKVDSILQDVERFTDIEKLYLYLRLPSGPSSSSSSSISSNDKISEQSCVSSSRMQQMHAFSWIRNHLEEHTDTSLPKQEVFDEYKSYCDNLGYHALSAADFGKIMKNVFPNMKARRLGMRGKSKYCYSGLRKKPFIHMPSLPSLDVHKLGDGCEGFEPTGQNSSGEDEIRSAACDLVCEWAQKVLSRQFVNVEDLARFLLNSHYISTKSVAALTMMTGSPSGAPVSVQSSVFLPTTDAHSFQPQVKMLTSPSIDAKQQLQRKIQKKQQEQKLHSPLSPEPQGRRADVVTTPCASTGIPCGSPALLSPQSTIGIVVAAVPSPVTVQRSRQLMSPSPVPVSTAESKVLPVNFQVVTQAVQPVNRCPKTPQNVPASPVGDRPARHRYAQILPKPAVTSTITLRSPPALLITKSSIKTVIPSPKDSSVNIVKMTAISLGPSNSTTSTAATTARPASAEITSHNNDLQPVTRVRSGSIAAMPSTLSKPGQKPTTPAVNIKLDVVDAIVRGREAQCGTTGSGMQVEGALKPRAASVPTPLAKISAELDRQLGNKVKDQRLPNESNLAASSNNNPIESTLYQDIAIQSTSNIATTSSSAFMTPPKDAGLASPSPRKRQGLHPDSSLTPVKKMYISEGTEDTKLALKTTEKHVFRSDTPVETDNELSSAAGKVLVKLNSSTPTRILAFSESPVGNSGFQTVDSSQNMQGQWEGSSSNVKNITTGTTAMSAPCQDFPVRNTSFQTFNRPRSVSQGQWEGCSSNVNSKAIVTHPPGQALLQPFANKNTHAMQVGSGHSTSSSVYELNAVTWNNEQQDSNQQLIYSHQGIVKNKQMSSSVAEPPVVTRPSTSMQFVQMTTDMGEHIASQSHVDYFPFNDDDMTQDSIVEELVQMEEQMKLNSSMQSFDGCEDMAMQCQQAALQKKISSHQANTSCYNLANTSSTPILTPTHSAEIIGIGQGLTSESPCSHFAPTTPVDSALGSSCQTPIGTPHSNCSSGVPPSPVECRNPFAFTPINSNITSYHDGSTISSSPVKPMQRPMATHPDKAKLDWMSNNYSSSSTNSNSGISILPNYQNLVDNQFRKPHAFAIPGQTYPSPVRHHDTHLSRLTPISPVQQQVASMGNLNKQEGFAVPAPLDNKTNLSSGSFRCRSVSPAVRQRNLSGTPNPNVRRYVVSPFSSPVTPEVLNIFANSQVNTSVSSMVQRSQSVPLNVMMQTDVLPMQAGGQTSNTKNITNVLLNKMDGDGDNVVRGVGMNNMPSSYSARMNLSQIMETTGASGFLTSANHQAMISPGSTAYKFTKPACLLKNNGGEQSFLSREAHGQSVSEENKQLSEEHQVLMVPPQQDLQQHQHQQSFLFDTTNKDLLNEESLSTVSQIPGQTTELGTGSSEFPGDMQLTSELSSSINDLTSLDPNLLFNPAASQQQVQYEEPTLEELKNDPIFQQICNETVNSAGFDWLESKDQATVEMLG